MVEQVAAVHELHRKPSLIDAGPVRMSGALKPCDLRMLQLRQGFDFAMKTRSCLPRQAAYKFQCNVPRRVIFPRKKYPPHTAFAEQTLETKLSKWLIADPVGAMY